MKVRAVVKHPGCAARILSVDSSLEGLQDLVGGNLQLVHLDPGARVGFYCDEDGIANGREPNFVHPTLGPILGPVVVTRVGKSGDEVDLTDEQARTWAAWFDERS